jgi:hypothetical protein
MAFTPVTRGRLQASLACVGTLIAWWRLGGLLPAVLAGLAAALAVLAWVTPGVYAPIQRMLDRMLHGMLAVLTWITLGLVYFGVFTPWRLWRAVTRHDPLERRPDAIASSYLRASPPAAPGRFDRQF